MMKTTTTTDSGGRGHYCRKNQRQCRWLFHLRELITFFFDDLSDGRCVIDDRCVLVSVDRVVRGSQPLEGDGASVLCTCGGQWAMATVVLGSAGMTKMRRRHTPAW
jgi:hypothetical protein